MNMYSKISGKKVVLKQFEESKQVKSAISPLYDSAQAQDVTCSISSYRESFMMKNVTLNRLKVVQY